MSNPPVSDAPEPCRLCGHNAHATLLCAPKGWYGKEFVCECAGTERRRAPAPEADAELSALRAENETLAKALERVVPYAEHSFYCPEAESCFAVEGVEATQEARAALASRRQGAEKEKP